MTNNISIRAVTPDDAPRLLEIYGYYVERTAISFEYVTPSEMEFRGRIARISEKYPYLAAVSGENIIGYAYAREFVGRAACDWCAEVTVYVAHDCRKSGVGKALYNVLENSLRKMGIINIYASIALPEQEDEYLTRNSAEFHLHMGFEQTAQFHRCGYKFGRWYDLIWVEKFIGQHVQNPPSVRLFKDISSEK